MFTPTLHLKGEGHRVPFNLGVCEGVGGVCGGDRVYCCYSIYSMETKMNDVFLMMIISVNHYHEKIIYHETKQTLRGGGGGGTSKYSAYMTRISKYLKEQMAAPHYWNNHSVYQTCHICARVPIAYICKCIVTTATLKID